MILKSTRRGGCLDIRAGDGRARISTAYKNEDFKKPLLKFISLPGLAGAEFSFSEGDPFQARWADSDEGMLADLDFQPRMNAEQLRIRRPSIVAVVTEEV